jgi:hypothetical protein
MANDDSTKLPPLESSEVARIHEALIAKYGVQLKPGESLSLDVERSSEHAHATLVLSNADDTFRLEIEAAVLATDETDDVQVAPAQRHLVAVDYIDAMLDEYFGADRHARLHDDWRVNEFEGAFVRSRGGERRPHLEAMADAWLEAGGDPDLVSD